MGPQKGECCRRRLVSYVPAVVLTTIIVILSARGSFLIRQAEYLGGAHGYNAGGGLWVALMLKPFLALMTLAVILFVMKGLFRGPRTLRHILLQLVFPAVCLLALTRPVKIPHPLAEIFLMGFEQRMLKQVDIEAIQQWLLTEGAKHSGRTYRYDLPVDLPASVAGVHPPTVVFSEAVSDRDMTVEFLWIEPHGDEHGLVVGPRSMQTPPAGMMRTPDGRHEFQRPIKPGAYVISRG